MFLRFEILGRFLEFETGRTESEPEEEFVDEDDIEPIKADEQIDHSLPLGFHMPGSGYDEEDA